MTNWFSFDTQQMFQAESNKLLEILLNVSENKLSELVIVSALSNLLLIPKKPLLLIEQGGLEILKGILSDSKNKVKINYYGLLCYWILSYEPQFVQYASSPNVLLNISGQILPIYYIFCKKGRQRENDKNSLENP
jgi:hypothetical protein